MSPTFSVPLAHLLTESVAALRPEAIEVGDDSDVRAQVVRVNREDATNRVSLSIDDVTLKPYTDRTPETAISCGSRSYPNASTFVAPGSSRSLPDYAVDTADAARTW